MTEFFELSVINRHQIPNNNTKINYYIGRGTPLGNPYTHLDIKDTIKVETREIAISKYKEYLIDKIKNKDIEILSFIDKIYRTLKISDVNLVCSCKPKSCHGDFIKEIIQIKINKAQKIK